jgi:pentapeptide MXKDX repeat protein
MNQTERTRAPRFKNSLLKVTSNGAGASTRKRQSSRSQSTTQGMIIMTTKACTIGLSAALLSLSIALAPAAFAQDKMGKDDAMKKEDTMSKDSTDKDAMKKHDGMMKKDDAMKKDGAMMKKDDGMKKN